MQHAIRMFPASQGKADQCEQNADEHAFDRAGEGVRQPNIGQRRSPGENRGGKDHQKQIERSQPASADAACFPHAIALNDREGQGEEERERQKQKQKQRHRRI